MTIKEKAKAYDEAIKVAKEWHTDAQIGFKANLETLFPELKESEDEKIRKALIDGFTVMKESKNCGKTFSNHNIPVVDILAWLEKQGDKDKLIKELGKYKVKYIQEVLSQQLRKQGEQNSTDMSIKEKAHQIAWETSKHYDPILSKESWCEMAALDMAHWLEKQASPVLFNSSNVGKNDDKVEPKFHEGDWMVTDKNNVVQIKAIENGKYILENTMRFSVDYIDECWRKWDVSDAKDGDVLCCESGWTCIFKTLNSDNISFSSYCFMDNTGWFCETGSEGHTLDKAFIKAYNGEIYPATKEQRDFLFQKIHEAGYEWDVEKKKLKKIEQKSDSFCKKHCKGFQETGKCFADGDCKAKREAKSIDKAEPSGEQKSTWSEEDECYMAECINAIVTKDSWSFEEKRKTKHWLKSLKDRVQPKQKLSKEDEKCIRLSTDIIDSALRAGFCVQLDRDRCVDWLKSLKERIGG